MQQPLPPLVIRGRSLVPIVQGGMGVGVSAHRLAGSVARVGAPGTISSVDLRRHHPDLMRETQHCRNRAIIDRANLVALDREIAAAKTIAGAINSPARVRELFTLGARGVQLGTAFAVTEEGDAAPEFKAVLANATSDDLVEFISVAGLPARAVRTPWLDSYLRHLPALQAAARRKPRCTLHFDCLAHCGLRDGIAHIGQFCIDTQLAAALRGDVRKGPFFRGAAALPFGSQIRPVRDLVAYMLGGSSLHSA